MNKILCTFCFCSAFSELYADRLVSFVSDKPEPSAVLEVSVNYGFIKRGFSRIASFGSELLSQFDVRFSNSLMIDNMIRYYSYKLNPGKYTIGYVLKDINLSEDGRRAVTKKLEEIDSEKDSLAIRGLHDEIIKFSDDKLFQRKVDDYCNCRIMKANQDVSNVSELVYFLRSIEYSFRKTVKSYCSDDINKGTFSKISDGGKEYTTPLAILPVNFIYRTFFSGNGSKTVNSNPTYKKIASMKEGIFEEKYKSEKDYNEKLKEVNNNLKKQVSEKNHENKKLEDRVRKVQKQLEDIKEKNLDLQKKLCDSEPMIKSLKTKQNTKDLKNYPKRDFNIDTQTSEVFDIERKTDKKNQKYAVYKLKGFDDPMFSIWIDADGRIIPTYELLGKKIRSVVSKEEFEKRVDDLNMSIYDEFEILKISSELLKECDHAISVILQIANQVHVELEEDVDITSETLKKYLYDNILCEKDIAERVKLEIKKLLSYKFLNISKFDCLCLAHNAFLINCYIEFLLNKIDKVFFGLRSVHEILDTLYEQLNEESN